MPRTIASYNAGAGRIAKFLTEGSIVYLYHTQVLVAHTDKVEGYKQMPDGLVRVIGIKLK